MLTFGLPFFLEARDVGIELKHTEKIEEITGTLESDYEDFKEVCNI